jgi:lipoprotein LpqH
MESQNPEDRIAELERQLAEAKGIPSEVTSAVPPPGMTSAMPPPPGMPPPSGSAMPPIPTQPYSSTGYSGATFGTPFGGWPTPYPRRRGFGWGRLVGFLIPALALFGFLFASQYPQFHHHRASSGSGSATVLIDGQAQAASPPVCDAAGNNVEIRIPLSGGAGAVDALVSAADPPVVTLVTLGPSAEPLSAIPGASTGDAVATRNGNTYKITGHATSSDPTSPHPFEVDVTCP